MDKEILRAPYIPTAKAGGFTPLFGNKQVSAILNRKINEGVLDPFDLMYDPEDTLTLPGILRTELSKSFQLASVDEEWFRPFKNDFEEKTRRVKRPLIKSLDESHDDLMVLV